MSLFKSSSKSKSTQTVTLAPPSKDELALTGQQVSIGAEQLANLVNLGDFTSDVFASVLPGMTASINKFLGAEDQITAESLGLSKDIIGAQGELLQSELAGIRQGVTLTPDQEKLIADASAAAIQSGLSDISAFRDDSLRALAQETSQARGLRPEDTPILDVGGRIARDANREASELISGVRAQEAEARLRYPIEAGTYLAGRTQAQQQFGSQQQAFINQLRQDAINNRLNLLATTGNIGVNTAAIGASPATLAGLMDLRARSATTNTKSKNTSTPGLGQSLLSVAGAAGGFMSGLGALGVGIGGAGPALGSGFVSSGGLGLSPTNLWG